MKPDNSPEYFGQAKNGMDLFFLVLASPLVVILVIAIAIAIFCFWGRPILFRQRRPGLHGEPFVMYKFRSMTEERDIQGNYLPDEKRLTRFGNFLRSTSLDELPELINVLKGEMSLVGPRPLLMQYLPLYDADQMRRHEVKPGITGWAQISGRNALSWEEKFARDIWYVKNQSLVLDLKIIILTFWKILRREGINQSGQSTMEEFKGSKRS